MNFFLNQIQGVGVLCLLYYLYNCQLSCIVFLSNTFQFDGFILSTVSAFPLTFQSLVNIWFIAFQEIDKLLKHAFLKNDLIFKCTYGDLNIFRHQNMVGYLLHTPYFDAWKCSTDKRCLLL